MHLTPAPTYESQDAEEPGPVRGPFDHVSAFWKPRIGRDGLGSLARYVPPGTRPEPGIECWTPEGPPTRYAVSHGSTVFTLFGSVEPVEVVPEGAEVLADIEDPAGRHHSYVLWYPSLRSVVVPFDPNAAIEAFWYEDYVPRGKRTAVPRTLLTVYYGAVKAVLPARVTMGLRRWVAHRTFGAEHLLEWPADESLDRLQRFMLGLLMLATGREELEFGWFWPDECPWAVILTHDVETADGLGNAATVASMERERGLRSSFNVVPLGYPLTDRTLQALTDDGFEIGVHGYTHDRTLFSSWGDFAARLATVNEFGRRLGASGFRSPATYREHRWFHLLAFEYDSSVSDTAPFEPQPGGCGSLFPFAVGPGITELPITLVQDHTLFGLMDERSAHTWVSKLRKIRRSNGMACVLTHPDPGAGYVGTPRNAEHYARLLDRIAASDAWVPLPRDLARWWRTRSALPSEEFGEFERSSVGRAVLRGCGEVEIEPPRRSAPVRAAHTVRLPPREPLRVWIDMANSPHVQFFRPLVEELEARGHSVIITARDYAQTIGLLDDAGLEYVSIGRHGGRGNLRKLVAIEQRARALAAHALREGADIAVHHNSYAQSLAAWALGIPSMTLMDYEHQPANHVSFRLSDVVLVPDSIPRASLARYGAGWRLRRYAGLKEDFYVGGMTEGGGGELELDGVDPRLPLLVLRPPPDLAAYHRTENVLWAPLLRYLGGQTLASVLVVPRTPEQAERLSRRASERIVVADRPISPGALLCNADGVITCGGTMAREAAALGIPAYTLFAGRQGQVDASLIRAGRLTQLSSADDFRLILLERCGLRPPSNVAGERERAAWLADVVEEAARR